MTTPRQCYNCHKGVMVYDEPIYQFPRGWNGDTTNIELAQRMGLWRCNKCEAGEVLPDINKLKDK